jgi:predicted HicB family RNase H-like nuclease
MKQINVRVSDEMHRAIKTKAAQESKTMTKVILALLKRWLEEDEQAEPIHAATDSSTESG